MLVDFLEPSTMRRLPQWMLCQMLLGSQLVCIKGVPCLPVVKVDGTYYIEAYTTSD